MRLLLVLIFFILCCVAGWILGAAMYDAGDCVTYGKRCPMYYEPDSGEV